jgi:hypothetical protein
MTPLKGLLIIVAVLTVLWGVIAGIAGYQLGAAPTGLDAVPCAMTTRIDFIIPMWKSVDSSQCTTVSASPPAASNPPATNAHVPAASSPPICDDPNAPGDGNMSGEMPC